MTKPVNLCMAPWTHTYLSPQTERRLCCASREPAQNFKQYIDAEGQGTGKYIPITLEEHWNSPHMMSVRKRMMDGEELPECDVCTSKLLNTDVYRSYFWHLFGNKYEEAMSKTTADGYTTMIPISWDYRFSNLCNFKCRMCGDMLSSAWETEVVANNMVDLTNPKNKWIVQPVRNEIRAFQEDVVRKEFYDAVEAKTVREIYWVGGEPLMYEEHWYAMKRIVELGYANEVYVRYNTNLSKTVFKAIDLYKEILPFFQDWQVCASLDGTGTIGEYIRDGLNYETWIKNFESGLAASTNKRQMRIDFTLTLPGLLDINNIVDLAIKYDVELLAKVVFAFSPDILLSPLAPPHSIIDPIVDKALAYCYNKAAGRKLQPLIDVLTNLKNRPDFSTQWPDTYIQEAKKGKLHLEKLEAVRKDKYCMKDILALEPTLLEWWNNV
jgi:hypothetical protein